jgi:MFS family permease
MADYFLIVRTFPASIRQILVAQGLLGLGMGIFAVLLNLYLRALGVSETTIGRLLAAQAFTAAFASVPMGWLADRTSRKATYITGILGVIVGYSLFTFFQGLPGFFLSAFISGVGSGALMVSVQPFLQEESRKKQRPYIFSLNFSLMLLMGIASGLLAGRLPPILAHVFGTTDPHSVEALNLTLRFGIVFLLLAILPAFRLPSRKKPDHPPTAHQSGQTGFSAAGQTTRIDRQRMAGFMFTSGLIGCGAGLIVPYFNLYFRDWVGASVAQIGSVFALGQLGTALGGFSSPFLSRRAGQAQAVFLTQLCSLPFMLIMAHSHSLMVCAICFFFRGAFMNMGVPIRQELMMDILPAHLRARAAAMDSLAWNLAWGLSMFFSGSLIRDFGYDFCLKGAFGCYLISAIVFIRLFSGAQPLRELPAVKR